MGIAAGIGAGVAAGVGGAVAAGGAAAGGLAAAGIAAAGSVAAAGISAGVGAATQVPGKKARISAPGLQTSAPLELASFSNMLEMGMVDSFALMQSSPVARMIANAVSSGTIATDTRQRLEDDLLNRFTKYQKWVEGGSVGKQPDVWGGFINHQVLQNSGYTKPQDLFDAQLNWGEQMAPVLARANQIASGNFDRRLGAFEGLNTLAGNRIDTSAANIDQIAAAEKARFLRDVNFQAGEASEDATGRANFGNFNPGGELAEIARIKGNAVQDADLEAMRRAMTTIGGLQGIQANDMSFLRGNLDPATVQGTGIGAVELGNAGNTAISAGTQAPTPTWGDTLGAGIGGAFDSFATGMQNRDQTSRNNALIAAIMSKGT